MLTEKDRKSLQFPGRHPFLAFYAIWFVPLYFALSVVLNLDAAAALAAGDGLRLMDVIDAWYSGSPSGLGVIATIAVVRVERAFGAVALCILSVGATYVITAFHRRGQRLLAYLRGIGQW